MIKQRKTLRKGQAHVEYLALKSAIDELRAVGHNLKSIHEKFKAEGRISMSYQALHENITRAERKARAKQRSAAGTSAPVSLQVSKKPPAQSGVRLAELDEAIQEMAAKRGNLRKKSGDDRKDVIG